MIEFTEEDRLDLEEFVAWLIFDYGKNPNYVRPSEEDCKEISTIIVRNLIRVLKEWGYHTW